MAKGLEEEMESWEMDVSNCSNVEVKRQLFNRMDGIVKGLK